MEKKKVEEMKFYNAKHRAIAEYLGLKRLKGLIKIVGKGEFCPSATLTHETRFQVMTCLYNGESENYCVSHTGAKGGTVSKYNIEYKAFQSL
jgi:hypothetical protein